MNKEEFAYRDKVAGRERSDDSELVVRVTLDQYLSIRENAFRREVHHELIHNGIDFFAAQDIVKVAFGRARAELAIDESGETQSILGATKIPVKQRHATKDESPASTDYPAVRQWVNHQRDLDHSFYTPIPPTPDPEDSNR